MCIHALDIFTCGHANILQPPLRPCNTYLRAREQVPASIQSPSNIDSPSSIYTEDPDCRPHAHPFRTRRIAHLCSQCYAEVAQRNSDRLARFQKLAGLGAPREALVFPLSNFDAKPRTPSRGKSSTPTSPILRPIYIPDYKWRKAFGSTRPVRAASYTSTPKTPREGQEVDGGTRLASLHLVELHLRAQSPSRSSRPASAPCSSFTKWSEPSLPDLSALEITLSSGSDLLPSMGVPDQRGRSSDFHEPYTPTTLREKIVRDSADIIGLPPRIPSKERIEELTAREREAERRESAESRSSRGWSSLGLLRQRRKDSKESDSAADPRHPKSAAAASGSVRAVNTAVDAFSHNQAVWRSSSSGVEPGAQKARRRDSLKPSKEPLR